MNLKQALDEAQYVKVEEGELGRVFVWKGGHTVNIYNKQFNGITDVMSVGEFSRNEATRGEVEIAIKKEIEQGDDY